SPPHPRDLPSFPTRRSSDLNVVPGVSSALAVPSALDIPLTCRGVSDSFWVVTGTTRSGSVSEDLRLAAQSSATVVILMGMSRIRSEEHTSELQSRENLVCRL